MFIATATAKRFRPPAQGCRFGYPGVTDEDDIQPQGGCVISSSRKPAQPRCGWCSKQFPTQGSRSGNPGLEGATALRFVLDTRGPKKLTHRHHVLVQETRRTLGKS
jgi:hypothetical protein